MLNLGEGGDDVSVMFTFNRQNSTQTLEDSTQIGSYVDSTEAGGFGPTTDPMALGASTESGEILGSTRLQGDYTESGVILGSTRIQEDLSAQQPSDNVEQGYSNTRQIE